MLPSPEAQRTAASWRKFPNRGGRAVKMRLREGETPSRPTFRSSRRSTPERREIPGKVELHYWCSRTTEKSRRGCRHLQPRFCSHLLCQVALDVSGEKSCFGSRAEQKYRRLTGPRVENRRGLSHRHEMGSSTGKSPPPVAVPCAFEEAWS